MVTAARLLSKSVLSGWTGLAVVLVSCSNPEKSRMASFEDSTFTSNPASEISFADWCGSWALQCEPTGKKELPPFTLPQVKSVFHLADLFLRGSSHWGFSQDDWKSSGMTQAFSYFEQKKLYEQVSQKLLAFGFHDVWGDGSAKLRVTFGGAGAYVGPSGLHWEMSQEQFISFESDSEIVFSGMKISNTNGAKNALVKRALVQNTNAFSFETDLFRVTDVPPWFVEREIFSGLDNLETKPVSTTNMALGANRFLGWFLNKDVSLSLDKVFLKEIARDYDVILPKPKSAGKWYEAVRKVLLRVNVLSLDAGDGQAAITGELLGGGKLSCSADGVPIVIEIRKDFGVELPAQSANDRVVMSFHGISAKIDLPGPIDPGFDLSTVEFTGEKIVMKGVPIVGEYSVDLSKFQQGQNIDFDCK